VPALRFAGQLFAASSPQNCWRWSQATRPVIRMPALGLERALRLVASLLADAIGSAPPAGEPAWPGEPLTQSDARVLRYLPTHMSAPEIAAELYLSANTVKTHLRHLYRKLGAHSRHEAVKRARAIGLLAVPSSRP